MSKRKNLRIQELRALAFMLVFFSHCTIFVGDNGDNLLRWLGGFGVEIFIVLSGYLATKYYQRNSTRIDNKKRVINKIFRFFPLHLITLVISIPLWLPYCMHKTLEIVINAMLIQVWVPKENIYFSFNMVSWYLGVTFFCVLLTPYVVRQVDVIKKVETSILLFSLIQVVELVLCFVSNRVTIDGHWLTYVFPISRLLDYYAGGILYEISTKINIKSKAEILKATGWIIGSIGMILSVLLGGELFSTAIWFVPSLCIVQGTCGKESEKRSMLSFLGDISFELFLFHQLIIRYLKLYMSQKNLYNRIIFFVVAFAISVSVSYTYNKFYNWVKRKVCSN